MENNAPKQIKSILTEINNLNLGHALRLTRELVNNNPQLIYDQELENIENEYRLMLDYMKRGFNDPQRAEIYKRLIVKLYRFASDTNHAES